MKPLNSKQIENEDGTKPKCELESMLHAICKAQSIKVLLCGNHAPDGHSGTFHDHSQHQDCFTNQQASIQTKGRATLCVCCVIHSST